MLVHPSHPRRGVYAKVGLLCLSLAALVLLSCDVSNQLLALVATATPTPTNTPTVTPTSTPTNTPRPTNTPTVTRTSTRMPTLPPPTRTLIPTKPPVAPLSSAILRASDFPPGFQALSAADLQQLKLSEADLARAFASTATTARPQNFTAFMNRNPLQFQIFLSFLLYPMRPLEKAALDLQLSNPDTALKTFGTGLTGAAAGAQVSLLPGMDNFGDASVGFTAKMTSGGITLRMESVIVSHGTAVEILMSIYQDGKQPAVKIGDMTKILDARVAAALGLK